MHFCVQDNKKGCWNSKFSLTFKFSLFLKTNCSKMSFLSFLRPRHTGGSYSTRKNILQTLYCKLQGPASHYGWGHLGNLQSSPRAPYNHRQPCNSSVSCNKTLQWMNVYSFIKIIPGFWTMPTETWHSSSLLHIQAKFPLSKVSTVCTNIKCISGNATCKKHHRALHHTVKPYDSKSNSILVHQLWLLKQLTYWVSWQHEILTPWNYTNAKNICSEIKLNLPCSLGHTNSQLLKLFRTEIERSSCEMNLILQKPTENSFINLLF